ncbi:lipocalin [Telmatospirillum siberiense]|uniref:Outer membrane lipoprotein Blc n=2 Tax=Telmatospirillum siberiense TaxID=382514 RepID=A0A2N3PPA2_9PROT|nr:lipocalin [Telmatospirillum siberiense]
MAEGAKEQPEAGLSAIPSLDVARYMGTWYEIAKYPNRFQKKCATDTRADYSLDEDGDVRVVNRCKLPNGETAEAVGAARQVGTATSATLKVRFAPSWLSFLPMVWGDYWVIDIDEGYQLVAVSEPTREYLWILSRTPKVDPPAYDALLQRLLRKGFDLGKLEISRQGD